MDDVEIIEFAYKGKSYFLPKGLIEERQELINACEMIREFHGGGKMSFFTFRRKFGMSPDKIETLEACIARLDSIITKVQV